MLSKLKAQSSKLKARSFQLIASIFLLLAFCLLLSFCTSATKSENDSSSTKFQQYYLQGEQLYIKSCSNCHQKNGSGLGLLYPPLNTSDYMDNNFQEVICLMKKGKKGELIVNGKSYNKPMPGVASLTNLEIAEIATYIYNTWEHKRGIVDVSKIKIDKADCPVVK